MTTSGSVGTLLAMPMLLRGLLLFLACALQCGAQFSLLPSGGELCSDYYLSDVASSADCFATAAAAVGLGGKTTRVVNFVGFNGCVYNVAADEVMYGTTTDVVRIASLQYICVGTFTTTVTSTGTTVTGTTVTTRTTTTTITTIVSGLTYSVINPTETCASYQIEEVASVAECFSQAVPYVGLGAISTLDVGNGFDFGCVYQASENRVLYSPYVAPGNPSAFWQSICRGLATTTTTTVTTTSSTTTVSTTTSTTETTSTSTVTTSTATTITETTTTSSSTTSTITLTTSTQTTSTATTTTYTGSSITTTVSTTTTSSFSTTSSTTTTGTSTTTETTTTSTVTAGTGGTAGFVGDDPLTIYGGVAKQFWLPEGELVRLLATPELQLWGSAFTLGQEQWINRLVLVGPSGEAVVQVGIRRDLENFTRGEAPDDHFSTLNITLDWLGGHALQAIPSPYSYAPQWGNVVFAFMRVPDFHIGEAQAEMMVMEGSTARIVVMAVAGPVQAGQGQAPAHAAQNLTASTAAARYAHLDFVLHLKQGEQKDKMTCSGLLPEIWGLQPASQETLTLLQ